MLVPNEGQIGDLEKTFSHLDMGQFWAPLLRDAPEPATLQVSIKPFSATDSVPELTQGDGRSQYVWFVLGWYCAEIKKMV